MDKPTVSKTVTGGSNPSTLAIITFTLEEFETEMSEVYSTSVSQETLDESPMAYKMTMTLNTP